MFWVDSLVAIGLDGLLLIVMVVIAVLVRKSPQAAGCVAAAAVLHLLMSTVQLGFRASDLLPYELFEVIFEPLNTARSVWGYVAYLLFAVQWLLMVVAAFAGRDPIPA